jgi:hypothetical protein
LACHTEPGLFGFALGKMKGLKNLTAYLSDDYDPSFSAVVPNNACLVCHESSVEKTLSIRGIRVSHKEINQAGFLCTECHWNVVHDPRKKINAMDKCITCHDSKKASSSCSLCHPIDVAFETGLSLKDFPKVHLEEPVNCRGCHTQEQEQACLNCHGLEMPHTEQFKKGGHARLGFINKSVCYRCHPEPNFCAGCHLGVSGHTGTWGAHGPTWIKNHQDKSAASCSGAGPCHSPNVCELCHPQTSPNGEEQ